MHFLLPWNERRESTVGLYFLRLLVNLSTAFSFHGPFLSILLSMWYVHNDDVDIVGVLGITHFPFRFHHRQFWFFHFETDVRYLHNNCLFLFSVSSGLLWMSQQYVHVLRLIHLEFPFIATHHCKTVQQLSFNQTFMQLLLCSSVTV